MSRSASTTRTRKLPRTAWTKEARPESHRPKGGVETKPRLRLSNPSRREAVQLGLAARAGDVPAGVERGIFQRNVNRALPFLALGSRLVDEKSNLTVPGPSMHIEQMNVTQVNAGALSDAELHTLIALLEKAGVTPDKLTPEDKALLGLPTIDATPATPSVSTDGNQG